MSKGKILNINGQPQGSMEEKLLVAQAMNKKPFEGDKILEKQVRTIAQKHNIFIVIETGTEFAATTERFATMVPFVYTMEQNPKTYQIARQFVPANSMLFYGSSEMILPVVIEHLNPNGKFLFYLDAHAQGMPCPLLKELEIISKYGLKPVIVIHDCKVPDHPELGYDSFNGWNIELENIREQLDAIYLAGENVGYTVSYNSEAEGAKRGVIFIEPKND